MFHNIVSINEVDYRLSAFMCLYFWLRPLVTVAYAFIHVIAFHMLPFVMVELGDNNGNHFSSAIAPLSIDESVCISRYGNIAEDYLNIVYG